MDVIYLTNFTYCHNFITFFNYLLTLKIPLHMLTKVEFVVLKIQGKGNTVK